MINGTEALHEKIARLKHERDHLKLNVDTPSSREERLNKMLGKRRQIMQRGLPLATGLGLEISPNWAPLITPSECKDIHYCDILTDQELTQRDKDNPDRVDNLLEVMPLTYILKEGLTIAACAPPQTKYDYIVWSHVLEHVPDFLGMLYQQRNVLKDEGTIAFVLPNFKGSGEYFRNESRASDVLNAYLLGFTRPSPEMVYEARKHCFHFKNIPYEGKKLEDTERPFGSDVWFNDVKRSLTSYQDAHCWAFTTKGFISVMNELRRGGYFNFDIIDIDEHSMTATGHCNEFYIKLRPTSPVHSEPPRPQFQIASLSEQKYYEKLYHATVNSTSWKLTRPLRAIKRFLT